MRSVGTDWGSNNMDDIDIYTDPEDNYPTDILGQKEYKTSKIYEFNKDPTAKETDKSLTISDITKISNIAEKLSESKNNRIAEQVVEEYEYDKETCEGWNDLLDEIMKLTKLTIEVKNTPWPNSSNVKIPLITDGVIKFYARSHSNLFKGGKVCFGKIVGDDPTGEKAKIAKQLEIQFNNLLLRDMSTWKRDTKNLIFNYIICGSGFKKTYIDSITGLPRSDFVPARNMVYDQSLSFEETNRKTHYFYLYPNQLVERMRSGKYLNQSDLFSDKTVENDREEDDFSHEDEYSPHLILEQHRLLDLDGDGYWEPYVVTVHYDTQKVLRIQARFLEQGISYNEDEEISSIEPVEYFTHFQFLPSPTGKGYGMGLGTLLHGHNQAINSITNQMIDAGRAQNTGGGFYDKRLQTRSRTIAVTPGAYEPVENYGSGGIGDKFYHHQWPQPSPVLFQLLNFLMDTGKEMVSTTEIMAGQSPGKNASPTTVMALIEQGLQVYSAVYDDLHSSFEEEFRKIKSLVQAYKIFDTDLDMDGIVDVRLISDPSNVTEIHKRAKSESIMPTLGKGANDREILRTFYESLELPDIDKLLPKENETPPPDPRIIEMQEKLRLDQERVNLDKGELDIKFKASLIEQEKLHKEVEKIQAEIEVLRSTSLLNIAKAGAEDSKGQIDQLEEKNKQLESDKKEIGDFAKQIYEAKTKKKESEK